MTNACINIKLQHCIRSILCICASIPIGTVRFDASVNVGINGNFSCERNFTQSRIQRPGRIGAEKHEIYVAAIRGHFFHYFFLQGQGGHGPLATSPDPLLLQNLFYITGCSIRDSAVSKNKEK